MKEFINREKDKSCQISLIFRCSEKSYLIWFGWFMISVFIYFKVISLSCEHLPYLPICSFKTNLSEIYSNLYKSIRQVIFQQQSQIIRNAELQISDDLFQSQSTLFCILYGDVKNVDEILQVYFLLNAYNH